MTSSIDSAMALVDGWDSYGGKKTTQEAYVAAHKLWQWVPTSDGGLQCEIHQDGWDVEIEIGPNGKIVSVFGEWDQGDRS